MAKKTSGITDYPDFLKDLLIAKSPTGHEFAAQAVVDRYGDVLVAHVESVKAKLKDVSNAVAETLVLLKATEREKRASNKEIESVRATLRSLQRVQL